MDYKSQSLQRSLRVQQSYERQCISPLYTDNPITEYLFNNSDSADANIADLLHSGAVCACDMITWLEAIADRPLPYFPKTISLLLNHDQYHFLRLCLLLPDQELIRHTGDVLIILTQMQSHEVAKLAMKVLFESMCSDFAAVACFFQDMDHIATFILALRQIDAPFTLLLAQIVSYCVHDLQSFRRVGFLEMLAESALSPDHNMRLCAIDTITNCCLSSRDMCNEYFTLPNFIISFVKMIPMSNFQELISSARLLHVIFSANSEKIYEFSEALKSYAIPWFVSVLQSKNCEAGKEIISILILLMRDMRISTGIIGILLELDIELLIADLCDECSSNLTKRLMKLSNLIRSFGFR
jgi:hypothetical protein